MKIMFTLRKFIFDKWSIFFILFVWVIFGLPFFLYGKIPFAGDYQVTFFPPWSQYAQFAMPVKNSAMPDVIDQLYPWKHLVIQEWKSGQIPLWNPYNFAGTPFMANNQSAVFSPMNLLFFIFPFKIAWALLILFQPLLAGYGMYWFARKIHISKLSAAFSSISFMFCGFLTVWMDYGTLGYAVSALPFALVGLEGYVQSKAFRYLLLISSALAFSFFSGHFQMSLYVLFATCCYFIFRYIKHWKKREFIFGFFAISCGMLWSSVQLFSSIEFYSQSLRSTLFERQEVIPWKYLFTSIAPDFFGNPVTGNDWFGHYAEWASYIGVLPLLFALFGLFFWKKNKFIQFFSLTAAVSLLLATPTFLGNLILYAHIPVLATSAAGRIIVLTSFSLAVVAGLGFDYWMQSLRKQKLFLGILGGIFLFVGWVIILGKIGLPADKVLIAKQNFLLPSFILGSGIIASIIAYTFVNKKILLVVSFFLLLITAGDMYRFASKWQSFSPQNLVFPDVGVTNFFHKIKNKRSLGNYGGQVAIYYQLPAIEGYDALYPERFGEFASFVGDGILHPAARSVVEFPRIGKYTNEAINLLGVDYIIHKISDTNKSWAFPVWKYPKDFAVVYKDSSYLVFKNIHALPRTFITNKYEIATNNNDILTKLFAPTTNQRKTLILEKDPHISQQKELLANARITSYSYNRVAVAAKNNTRALLFLSDTYFPGWHAYIDGKETPIYRADYTFRAIVLPKGNHTIIFSYMPASFLYGVIAAGCGAILLVAIYFVQKKRVR